jgi:class 3 adenylate cyclase
VRAERGKPDQIVTSRTTLDRAKKRSHARSPGLVNLRGRQAEIEVFEIADA